MLWKKGTSPVGIWVALVTYFLLCDVIERASCNEDAGSSRTLEILHSILQLHNMARDNVAPEATLEESQKVMFSRTKKGSVSWLLAAAIRMCKQYPKQCLRQTDLENGNIPENMDLSFMENYP